MYETQLLQDTDLETLSSDDESVSSTMEVDDVLPFTPPNLPPIMSYTKKVSTEQVMSKLADDFRLLTAPSTMEADDVQPVTPPKFAPIISFMSKVLKEQVMNNLIDDFKLLTLGIHAIMLDSGFVCLDPDSGKKIDGFRLPNRWDNNTSSTRFLCYTLPELLQLGVVLRFQNSGDSVDICGSLSTDKESVKHQLSLKPSGFMNPFDLAFGNGNIYPENEILEFHGLVNGALAYPLLIDLCESAGLVLPPCFTSLPVEVKFKIVELLDGVDIARAACVCSELRDLTSDDDLWRQKFFEEFRVQVTDKRGTWKSLYAFYKTLGTGKNMFLHKLFLDLHISF